VARLVIPTLAVIALFVAVAFIAAARHQTTATAATNAPGSTGRANPATASPNASNREVLAPAPADSTGSSVVSPAAARSEGKPGADPVAELDALTAGVGPSGVSIAALNLATGATFNYGATGGMTMGSVAKLDILETLLLQHMNSHATLSSNEVSLATTMIENSNDNAADAVWADVGNTAAVAAANVTLGIPNLVIGAADQWGLGTTCAADQLTLLKNLATNGGPLDSASQQFALGLMRNVEADQRWGVGSVADAGTSFANKNGWLNVDTDHVLWLINSDGIVTIKGQQVLISVLTQHNASEAAGITLVESIAATVAPVVS
jgi:hypothetical protein